MASRPLRGSTIDELRDAIATGFHVNDPTNSDDGYKLNQRRVRALQEVDNAHFSRFHLKVILVAGVGFFADAYDLFAINVASVMLGYVYTNKDSGVLSTRLDIGLKIAAAVGTFFGALIFGWLADTRGRKGMYGIELVMIITGTLGQVISNDGPRVSVFGALMFWRFIMGLGIGGDYPSSAVIASEFAPVHLRGRFMTAVIASQGWGQLLAASVASITIAGFKNSDADGKFNKNSVDLMWRVLIGLGCVPGVIALFFRLTIPETPRFTMDIERNIDQAVLDIDNFLKTGTFVVDPDAGIERAQAPKASWKDFKQYFSDIENLRVLVGCSYCWFALDVAFYGLGLNPPFLAQAMFEDPDSDMYQHLRSTTLTTLTVTVAGLIPGFWICFLFIDRLGRKLIQYTGFAVSTIIFVIMSILYSKTPPNKALAALYCILNVFLNFGPNTTTFMVPAESFPTRYRSTVHGIAAASGKLGAIITQVVYAELTKGGVNNGTQDVNKHTRILLAIYAVFTLTGMAATWLIQETKGLSLEYLSNEDQENFITGPLEKPDHQ